jgi:cytochrome c oxidase cbb3-type subunit III
MNSPERQSPLLACIAVACALLPSLAGCSDLPGRPDAANRPVPPHEVADFDTLFQQNCAGCHGREGQLGPAPPLNDPLFLAIVPDEELERIVREGRQGTQMPGFSSASGGTLTDEQTRILATGLKRTWSDAQFDMTELPPYAASAGDAQRGAQIFATACANCHGALGEGKSAAAIHDIAFLSLVSNQALRRLIITGRPDLGMPSYAGREGRSGSFVPLRSTEIDDLVALLAAWRTETSIQEARTP